MMSRKNFFNPIDSNKGSLLRGKRFTTIRISLLVLFLIASLSIPTYLFLAHNHASPCSSGTTHYLFGTLETDPSKAAQECAAGVQVAMQTIGWENYEPQDGMFDESYMDDVKARIKMDLAAGLKVVISPAIHYVPAWVMALPGARYVNQYGVAAPNLSTIGHGEPNFVFSQAVRDKVARFEKHMMRQLADDPAIGLKNIWAVRYVNGTDGETLYPPDDDHNGHTNSYWAYDANAQGMGSNRPASLPPCPFPGWTPGEKTYRGQPFSTDQVRQWYAWYFNAHMDFVNWHTRLYRDPFGINYQGYLQLLMPGFGARAFEYNDSITHYLDGSQDPNATLVRAAIWYKLFPALINRTRIVAYVSSMADGSGSPPDNGCRKGDALVNYATDLQVNDWSATRYIAGLADKYGMPKNGENPGSNDPDPQTAYGLHSLSIMQATAAQMQACNFQGIFWAYDKNLYDGAFGAPLSDYARVIAQYNGPLQALQ